MKKRVLFVDDEPTLLKMYRVVFEQEQSDWDIVFANGAVEALDLMDKSPFNVIVSDMRMPGMTGAELVLEVMKRYPLTSRLIMSGYADQESVAQCLSATHQFLPKPCQLNVLRDTLSRVCALDDALMDPRIKNLVSQLNTIPSIPSLYFRIMEALSSPDASLSQIGEIISQDPGMTAKILQLVNSAFFGIARRISNPVEAIQMLGVGTVRSLVLSLHVFSCFDHVQFKNFSIERVWTHSLMTARIAQKIAKLEKVDRAVLDETYVGGMLHDIGKVMLASSLSEPYQQAATIAQERKVAMVEAEREVFGVSHAEVGAYLLGLWGLPITIVEAVALHQVPGRSAIKAFCPLTAVHAANVFEHQLNPNSPNGKTPELDMDYLAELGLADRVKVWREAAIECLAPTAAN